MRKVIFPIVKIVDTNIIDYPDDKTKFKNARSSGDNIIADYSGSLPLDDYIAPPEYRKQLTRREFMSLFSPQENRAVKNKAKTDDTVDQLWDILMSSDPIDLDFQQTIDGMGYLVSVGVLSQARHDEIMQGVIV